MNPNQPALFPDLRHPCNGADRKDFVDHVAGGGYLGGPAAGEAARQVRFEFVGFFRFVSHRRVLAVGLKRGNRPEILMPGFMPGIHVSTVTQWTT
jgi:hypothetical protein